MKLDTIARTTRLAALCAGLALAACSGDEAGDAAEAPAAMEGMAGMEGMKGMEGMHMDPGMMRRHAAEADSMASRVRAHVREMRQRSPEQQHEHMGEHVAQVSGMLGLMSRQDREMDMGMGMSDEQMGAMMGMSGEEHRRMMEEMAALRAEMEQLQIASREEVRERMPAHLDRVERMAAMMEESAEHMRGM